MKKKKASIPHSMTKLYNILCSPMTIQVNIWSCDFFKAVTSQCLAASSNKLKYWLDNIPVQGKAI